MFDSTEKLIRYDLSTALRILGNSAIFQTGALTRRRLGVLKTFFFLSKLSYLRSYILFSFLQNIHRTHSGLHYMTT